MSFNWLWIKPSNKIITFRQVIEPPFGGFFDTLGFTEGTVDSI